MNGTRVVTMRIGHGGGGFGDAVATQPCAHWLRMHAEQHGNMTPYFATRFSSPYRGVIDTLPYDQPQGDLVELHWATTPKGTESHFEAYLNSAMEAMNAGPAEATWIKSFCGGVVRPVFHGACVARRERKIAVNTYAAWAGKRWPPQHWSWIVEQIRQGGWDIVQLNCAHDAERLSGVRHVVKADAWEMARELATCAMYLGNESALWFIAMGTDTPSVTVHGCCDGSWYNVNPQLHRTINAVGPCKHCYDRTPSMAAGYSQNEWEQYQEAMWAQMRECGVTCLDHDPREVLAVVEDHLLATWRGGAV